MPRRPYRESPSGRPGLCPGPAKGRGLWDPIAASRGRSAKICAVPVGGLGGKYKSTTVRASVPKSTPALALAFHPNSHPKTCTSPRAQGLDKSAGQRIWTLPSSATPRRGEPQDGANPADNAGKAALSPKNRLIPDGLRSIKMTESAKPRRRSRPALIRFLPVIARRRSTRKAALLVLLVLPYFVA